jgi:hypothetical protein
VLDPGQLLVQIELMYALTLQHRFQEAVALGRRAIEVHGRTIELSVPEVTAVAGDIDGQIYARDFKLIDQSDMIVSYVPELASGKPGLSSGVERELQHAYETTKEVYLIWKPKVEPSPFVTHTAKEIFNSVEALLKYFQKKGYLQQLQLRFANTPGGPDERDVHE